MPMPAANPCASFGGGLAGYGAPIGGGASGMFGAGLGAYGGGFGGLGSFGGGMGPISGVPIGFGVTTTVGGFDQYTDDFEYYGGGPEFGNLPPYAPPMMPRGPAFPMGGAIPGGFGAAPGFNRGFAARRF